MLWAGVQRKSLRVLRSGVRTGASSLVQVVSWLVRPIKEQIEDLQKGKINKFNQSMVNYSANDILQKRWCFHPLHCMCTQKVRW